MARTPRHRCARRGRVSDPPNGTAPLGWAWWLLSLLGFATFQVGQALVPVVNTAVGGGAIIVDDVTFIDADEASRTRTGYHLQVAGSIIGALGAAAGGMYFRRLRQLAAWAVAVDWTRPPDVAGERPPRRALPPPTSNP